MTRKDFILLVINKKIKPTVYISVLVYTIYFLIQDIIDKNSNERSLLVLFTLAVGLLLLLIIIHLVINYLTTKTPERIKSFFNKISKITEMVSGLLLIVLIVETLKQNKIYEFIIMFGITIFLIYTKKTKSIQ